MANEIALSPVFHLFDYLKEFTSLSRESIGRFDAILNGYFFVFIYKKGYVSLEKALLSLKDGFRQVTLAFVIVVSFLVFYALVDFNRFWTVFHEIFFTNDLWLLDPRVSVMINMFPEEFFFGMVMRIALGFIICYAAITFISCYGIRRYFKKANLIEKDN